MTRPLQSLLAFAMYPRVQRAVKSQLSGPEKKALWFACDLSLENDSTDVPPPWIKTMTGRLKLLGLVSMAWLGVQILTKRQSSACPDAGYPASVPRQMGPYWARVSG